MYKALEYIFPERWFSGTVVHVGTRKECIEELLKLTHQDEAPGFSEWRAGGLPAGEDLAEELDMWGQINQSRVYYPHVVRTLRIMKCA